MFYIMLGRMSHKCFAASIHWTPIRHVTLILSWGKASIRIGNAPPHYEAYHLLMECIVPLVCVNESGIPGSEIGRKIKKYAEIYGMSTLYLH
jgi:hypothetical protein